ncbi:hypothetical protein [Micromonospora taraxaci]
MPESTDGPVEAPLTGGFIADVVRVGDTVRRTPPTNLDFVGRVPWRDREDAAFFADPAALPPPLRRL